MNDLIIQKSLKTPLIELNANSGIFKIESRSIPEDPGHFYMQVFSWVNEYFKSPAKTTTINIKLEYINSGSAKALLELFRILKTHYLTGNDMNINWYFEEDDEVIHELGEHYKNSVNIPFNLIDTYE